MNAASRMFSIAAILSSSIVHAFMPTPLSASYRSLSGSFTGVNTNLPVQMGLFDGVGKAFSKAFSNENYDTSPGLYAQVSYTEPTISRITSW